MNRFCKCGKKIHETSIKCRSCEIKRRHKIGILIHPNFKGGWEIKKCLDCGKQLHNWDALRCHSCAKKGNKNSMFGRPPSPKANRGKREIYKGFLMRSTWEIAYAKYLDKNNIKWLYEPKTFDLGNTTYTPDFYLPKKDLYIEIKGYKSDIFKNKFKLFKQITNKNIIILNKFKLQKIGVL